MRIYYLIQFSQKQGERSIYGYGYENSDDRFMFRGKVHRTVPATQKLSDTDTDLKDEKSIRFLLPPDFFKCIVKMLLM